MPSLTGADRPPPEYGGPDGPAPEVMPRRPTTPPGHAHPTPAPDGPPLAADTAAPGGAPPLPTDAALPLPDAVPLPYTAAPRHGPARLGEPMRQLPGSAVPFAAPPSLRSSAPPSVPSSEPLAMPTARRPPSPHTDSRTPAPPPTGANPRPDGPGTTPPNGPAPRPDTAALARDIALGHADVLAEAVLPELERPQIPVWPVPPAAPGSERAPR
ncbi:hypothetical protein [Streptomyces inhibens]|uniref:hypothetical protein n=1 Tax=Streptomyces inhibens TaxID=2293571 RepID=UPI001EE752ED|nr:hypothetical protein [Streptomyces inhibens]UKY54053.1 hypothetical protein KI385_38110 [Streptomyces inhibens]